MSGASRPPTPAQRRSADPARSVWVTANAGTGKTRVLVDRVLRLLLAGADPEGILCLTFTKAAAAEMTLRVEERLAAWTVAPDDAALAAEIEGLTGAPPDPARVGHARRLFAQVLELPRGLGIMTIHALCGALLRRFPLEAGVPPHFDTIDDRTSAELLREARERVLRAARDRASPLGRSLELLAVTVADASLSEILGEALAQRVALLRSRDAFQGDTDALVAAVYRALRVDPAWEPPEIVRRACADGEFDGDGLARLAAVFAAGGKRQQEASGAMVSWLSAVAGERHATYELHEAVFLTKAKQPRRDVCSEKFRREQAALVRHYDAEQARLGQVCDRIRALGVARRTEALLRVAFAAIDAYERLKARKAVLDYDDLIERADALLHRPGKAEWVLYKLDARVDHVLVDEAQDTSPRQWRIVLKLTEEFFAGGGARGDLARTLFVVGDEKQSIYSFQGADLAGFRRVRRLLEERAAGAGRPFQAELLDRSFRSAPAVLAAVDAVFALPEAGQGLLDPGQALRHDTERAHDPGLVEIWPLARPAAPGPALEPWPLPGTPRVGDEPERRVARAIARAVRGWLDRGEVLRSTGRRVRPGDVMILLSRRGILQERLVRALKQAGVPAAGADRLALGDHIAVQDLVALGRAVLLPEDDLNLACLLKSPLLGLGEEDLFELAWGRGGSSLHARLREAAERAPGRFGVAAARLAGWLERADFAPPFEFYTWVLGADGGRRRLLARLGPDAAEPIEAFLAQALAHERGHPSSLEGFLHWLSLGSDELKRDPESARDVVRVTTVHGAKGLEAPIVFLADAGPRGPSRHGRLHWTDPAGPDGAGVALPLWRAAAGERDAVSEAICARNSVAEHEERQRLLYVALTRARDRLYVTGWLPRSGDTDDPGAGEPCWHELLRRALRSLPGAAAVELPPALGLPGEALRLERGAATAAPVAEELGAEVAPELPAWIARAAPVEPSAAPLAPSRAGREGAATATGPRFRRGLLVHRLLQFLPDLPQAERSGAAERLLAAPDLGAAERAEVAAGVLGLLLRPEFAPVFAAGSRAEQPICGTVGGRSIVGQVDRLVVTPDEVLLVEFKSGRFPASDVAATPATALGQLAAYRALLARIYPGRRFRAGLLWTELPRLDEVPGALLDRHAPDAA